MTNRSEEKIDILGLVETHLQDKIYLKNGKVYQTLAHKKGGWLTSINTSTFTNIKLIKNVRKNLQWACATID